MWRLLTLLLAVASVVPTHAVLPTGQSFCQYYTGALFGAANANDPGNQTALIQAVVLRAATGYTGATPYGPVSFLGLFADDPANPVRDIFAGRVQYRPDYDPTMPATFAPNYVGGAATDTAILVNHLVSFFGAAFGCATTNPAFNTYNGQPKLLPRSTTLQQVHGGMGITEIQFSFFNSVLAQTLESFGVTKDDVVGTALPLLLSFGRCSAKYTNTICSDPSCQYATPAEPGCVAQDILLGGASVQQQLDDDYTWLKRSIAGVLGMVTVIFLLDATGTVAFVCWASGLKASMGGRSSNYRSVSKA